MAELPPFVPAITYDGDVSEFRKFGPHLAPNEFEDWRQEVRCRVRRSLSGLAR
jgi:hypothetical protein